jgi:hypothetical protein
MQLRELVPGTLTYPDALQVRLAFDEAQAANRAGDHAKAEAKLGEFWALLDLHGLADGRRAGGAAPAPATQPPRGPDLLPSAKAAAEALDSDEQD